MRLLLNSLHLDRLANNAHLYEYLHILKIESDGLLCHNTIITFPEKNGEKK